MKWTVEARGKLGDILLVCGVLGAIVLAMYIGRIPQYSPLESEEQCPVSRGRHISARVCTTQSQITNIGDKKVSVEVVLRSTASNNEERQIETVVDDFVLPPQASTFRFSVFLSNNRLLNVYDAESFALLETVDLTAHRTNI